MKKTHGKPELNIFSKADKIIFSTIGILALLTIVFWKSVISGDDKKPGTQKVKKEKKSNKDSSTIKQKDANVSDVSILRKWEMPAELKEVSGISYMDDQRFVCVQDEAGTVFIFNRASNQIEKRISFAQKGDFEGVALKGNTAYVVRADGKLFEVDITGSEKNPVKEYRTSLTVKQNVEGVCYDKDNNRLLLAIKDQEPNMPGYKGIYSFDLANKKFIEKPVYKIDLNHELIKESQKKSIMPSEIAVHPTTGEIFITDGPQSRLLIMDKEGSLKSYLDLGKDFSQPEGITISPGGEIFISNEGTREAGNIIEVSLQKN